MKQRSEALGAPGWAQTGLEGFLRRRSPSLVYRLISVPARRPQISGDSDLLPVVELAKNYGIIARLVHGRVQTYHQDLWDNADERCEITQAVIDSIARK